MDESTTGGALLVKATKPVIWTGVALILLGALSIYAPQQSGMTVGVLVGIFLVVSGLFRASLFWIAPSWGWAFLRLLFGVLAIIAGGMMIADPALGLQLITIVAITYLLVDGFSAILFGMRLPPGSGGLWIILSGVISAALGILIWRQWPLSGDFAVGILIGVKLLMDGIALVAVGMAARRAGAALSQT